MSEEGLLVFALNSSRDFGEGVAARLSIPLSPHEEREFEDGEHKTRPLIRVRGKDVFVIQSLFGDSRQSVNDKLCRLLFFLGALRDASAGRVTAVLPYLCYARKDRKSKARDAVTTRYVATFFEAVGVNRVLVLDVHNVAAFQNAWRAPTDHLEAKNLRFPHPRAFSARPSPSEKRVGRRKEREARRIKRRPGEGIAHTVRPSGGQSEISFRLCSPLCDIVVIFEVPDRKPCAN